MELKEFIKETLVQIAQGVREAQEELKEQGTIINPELSHAPSGEKIMVQGRPYMLQQVDFTVALTLSESGSSKKGISVSFASILAAGGNTNNDSRNEATNTIKFKVPIVLPPLASNAKK